MSEYKLTYFNIAGRGEVARLLFAAANVPYKDIRVTKEQWKQLKSKMPFGQLPVLEVDGKMLCQSSAIACYLAKRFGLAGKTDWEEAQANMILACVVEVLQPFEKMRFEDREDKKKELLQIYQDEQLPAYLAFLDAMLINNKGGDGFFVGDGMTHADIAFSHCFTYMVCPLFKITCDTDQFPKLKALKERVDSHPGIAKWLSERPKGDCFLRQ